MAAAESEPESPDHPPRPGNANSPTPLSLLERIRANEPAAWQRLVALYQRLVQFWCSRGGLGGADAEDVVQEVFAAAAAGLAGFRRDRPGDTFRGWLRGITRNHVLLHFRRNARQTPAEGGSDAWAKLQDIAGPLDSPPEGEDAEVGLLYHRALEQVRCEFAERTWQAFWLTVVEDRSPAGLAGELGMSVATIRQAKSRVLRRIKQEVGDLID
jgi:RNA polymerase sigma-70 factor (ECF subfamily)